jgi:hypothetical protein
MASLTNTKIKNTYVSLLKVADNGQLDGTLQEITDGAGNTTGVQLNTGGDLTASGTVAFGSLKDSGENITISKFVDAADGIGSNNNDTTIPTSAAVTAYVSSQITLEDLDFAGDSGTGSVDLDSQTLTIQGTANEIETVAGAQTLTIGLPSTINVNVNGNLTGNVTPTSILQDGVTATTQLTSDNSTKVATTAFVKSVVTAENLDIAGTSGTGSVDLDSQTLTIAGTTNEIETSASGQTITVGLPSDVTIGNNLTVTTNATVSGILGVTGAAGVDGDFDVATNKFTVQAATGNTLVAGTLGVTGNTTLSTVDVTGLASLDGGIDVDGAFTVANTSGDISTSGDLGVTGTSTLGVINASGLASLDGGIDVDGAFTVADTTGNISTTGSITAATGTINGLLDVVGEVQATFLDINGNGEVSGNLAVDTDTLFVDSTNDRVGINKTNPAVALDVTGDITSSATITGTTLAGTLSTAAQTNITSVGTLSSLAVSGDLTVDTSTLKVDSANNRVGIGATVPRTILDIASDKQSIITLAGTSSNAQGDLLGGVYFYNFDGSNNGPNNAAKITAVAATTTGADGDLIFSTIRGASEGDDALETMRINFAGNVGIGTSIPSSILHIKEDSGQARLLIEAPSGENSFVGFQNTGGTQPAFLIGYNATDSAFVFYDDIANTERLRIPSTGGLTFNGDTAAANALDDYEEGTWTPVVTFGGNSADQGYNHNTGTYTKIGRQVTANCYVEFNDIGTSTGGAVLTGLPFTIASGLGFFAAATFSDIRNISFADYPQSYGVQATSSITLGETTNAGTFSALLDTDFENNTEFMISITYFV